MSKSKKEAFAAKQQTAANLATSRQLVPLPDNAQMSKTAKRPVTRKQSRGK